MRNTFYTTFKNSKLVQSDISDEWMNKVVYGLDHDSSAKHKLEKLQTEIDHIPDQFIIGTAYQPNRENPNDMINLT